MFVSMLSKTILYPALRDASPPGVCNGADAFVLVALVTSFCNGADTFGSLSESDPSKGKSSLVSRSSIWSVELSSEDREAVSSDS